jgi:cytochrome c556
MYRNLLICAAAVLLLPTGPAVAGDTPQEARHEVMEDVGGAAKPIGKMLKGEQEFDAATAMESLETWAGAAKVFGEMFPPGSESGYDTEAKSTIWSDRAGFDAALADFARATDAAIAANPRDLDGLKAAAGPVFKTCKGCHEGYREEDEG